jgi:hypothetical protein
MVGNGRNTNGDNWLLITGPTAPGDQSPGYTLSPASEHTLSLPQALALGDNIYKAIGDIQMAQAWRLDSSKLGR